MRRAIRLIVVVVVVAFLVATARLFVWPPTDAPAHADAVVALGGDPGQRRAHLAMALAARGDAPVAVISLGGYHPPCPKPPPKVEVICFVPNPATTQGEAEFATRLAARRHWRSMIVVSERSQSTRARLRFRRCTSARLLMVPVPDRASHLVPDVVYEWGALLKAFVVNRAC